MLYFVEQTKKMTYSYEINYFEVNFICLIDNGNQWGPMGDQIEDPLGGATSRR